MTSNMPSVEPWPRLSLREWADTKDTLHLWTQIVGKIRLALAPHVNHWWNVTLYVTARGLTTLATSRRMRIHTSASAPAGGPVAARSMTPRSTRMRIPSRRDATSR